jgi:hypothetical protein
MALVELTPSEEKLLEAAREYADAVAVMRGPPPWSTADGARMLATKGAMLAAAFEMALEREPGPSIPDMSGLSDKVQAYMKLHL